MTELRRGYGLEFGYGEEGRLHEPGGPEAMGADLNVRYLKIAQGKATKGTNLVLCDSHI